MSVEVRFWAWCPRSFGIKNDSITIQVDVPDSSSLDDLVRQIIRQYPKSETDLLDPETGQLTANLIVALNGEFLDPRSRQSRCLKTGDKLMFLPRMAGGRQLLC